MKWGPCRFSPDRRLLAVGTRHQKKYQLNIWDTKTDETRKIIDGLYIRLGVFSPDGKYLATTLREGRKNICVYDTRNWEFLKRKSFKIPQLVDIRWDPSGEKIALAAKGGGVYLLALENR